MNTPQQPTPTPGKGSSSRQWVLLVVALLVLAGAGYNVWRQLQPKDRYQFDPSQPIAFKDHAQSNAPLDGGDVAGLTFVDTAGQPVDLRQYRGKKNVVLVITRGATSGAGPGPRVGRICLYCASQTSRLIANYPAIRDHDAEAVVVFPIQQGADSDQLKLFQEATPRGESAVGQPPFPLVLDMELRAVDRLGIRDDLAKPATYILDKRGMVRFAYVGATIADRPSVQSILAQLDAIRAVAP